MIGFIIMMIGLIGLAIVFPPIILLYLIVFGLMTMDF